MKIRIREVGVEKTRAGSAGIKVSAEDEKRKQKKGKQGRKREGRAVMRREVDGNLKSEGK